MVSREFIWSVVRAHHAIAVHMKGPKRLDGLSDVVYVIYDLNLDDDEEKELLSNKINDENTYGLLRVKAIQTSEVGNPLPNSPLQEYTLDTTDIEDYETLE